MPSSGRAIVAMASLVIVCGCGARTPTTPTNSGSGPSPAPPSANRAPEIVGVTITPPLGVIGLTTMSVHVDARDPDGDALTYTWLQANAVGPDSADYSFQTPGATPSRIRVTDSGGLSATAAVPPHEWANLNALDGFFGQQDWLSFALDLNQTGTILTGRFVDWDINDYDGTIDPAQPGTIDAAGHFRMRIKSGAGDDMLFIGQLVLGNDVRFLPGNPGFMGKGTVVGGRHNGQSFTFGRHDPY